MRDDTYIRKQRDVFHATPHQLALLQREAHRRGDHTTLARVVAALLLHSTRLTVRALLDLRTLLTRRSDLPYLRHHDLRLKDLYLLGDLSPHATPPHPHFNGLRHTLRRHLHDLNVAEDNFQQHTRAARHAALDAIDWWSPHPLDTLPDPPITALHDITLSILDTLEAAFRHAPDQLLSVLFLHRQRDPLLSLEPLHTTLLCDDDAPARPDAITLQHALTHAQHLAHEAGHAALRVFD